MLACLIASVVFVTGCKKDISSIPTNSESKVITGNVNSTTMSAQAAVAYEGFGANAVGGSTSSTVYHVTNLNSSGPGSFRDGLGSNRTILFDVSGTISGSYNLTGYSYLTIDGNGQSVTLDGKGSSDVISFAGSNTHHCILKGIRTINGGNDGINVIDGAHDIMITNCSSSNNVDGAIDIAGANNVTVQYCIMGPSAAGGPGCMLITSTNVSAHHNLFSPSKANTPGERCPLVHCNYSPVGNPNADISNNIIWKFGRDGGTGSGYGSAIAYNATANIINNYYYTAGTSKDNATSTSDGYGSGATGKAYMAGNVSANSGVDPNGRGNHAEFPAAAVTTQDACSAAQLVLANAGPRPLHSADQALVNDVSLTVCGSGPPPNQAPTANAGTDQTTTSTSVTVSGSGSDPDGTITSYAWSKISGSGGTITSPGAASTTITDLSAGSYTFKLTVTDDKGATASDNVNITVNSTTPPNQPPTVNAGADQTTTSTSVTVSGIGSDPDGSIDSYVWSKVSGSGGTITSPGAASTTITGLSVGTYTFKLTVTDDKGATASDNVNITVNSPPPQPNQPPSANAGPDQTINFPNLSVTLSGSGSDPDGTIVSYAWSKVSGIGGVITSPNTASTTVTGLVVGIYRFRLIVTDDKGATSFDDVTITVNHGL